MDIGTSYISLSWCCITLEALLVLNRLYVSSYRDRSKQYAIIPWLPCSLSDILVLLAWCLNLTQTTCDTLLYRHGALRNGELSSGRADTYTYRVYFIENLIYWMPLYCIKGAICCFYLEMTPITLSRIRAAIWVAIAAVVAGAFYTELNFLLICRPISRNWDLSESECTESITVAVGIAWHMATDVYSKTSKELKRKKKTKGEKLTWTCIIVYAIPFFILRNIRIPTFRQKISTFLMLFSGFILVLLSIPNFLTYVIPSLSDPFMWAFYASLSEQTWAVVVACLPSTRMTLLRDGYWCCLGREERIRKERAKSLTKSMTTQAIRERVESEISPGWHSRGTATNYSATDTYQQFDVDLEDCRPVTNESNKKLRS